MQTFLPSSDYEYCAQILDSKRLNKQILECYQILNILSNNSPTGAWRNHPAVLMWKGAEWELKNYVDHMIYEANFRGIGTTKNVANLKELELRFSLDWGKDTPVWQKPEHIHRVIESHKANLYRKDPFYYAEYRNAIAKPCCDKCLYYWATHVERLTAIEPVGSF